MKKEDMRTKRTKKSLKKAISALIMQESIEAISVTDICKKADINRVTFYTHYEDKYALLHELLHDIIDLIGYENQLYYQKNKTGDIIKDYTNMISHSIYKICFENKVFIKALSNQENLIFTKMVEEIIVKEGLKHINEINNLVEYKYPNEFIIQFLLGGFSKLVFQYALNENNLSEKDFFIYFNNLFYSLLKSEIFFKMK